MNHLRTLNAEETEAAAVEQPAEEIALLREIRDSLKK
jgi:large-conductance mechanosensitive channel